MLSAMALDRRDPVFSAVEADGTKGVRGVLFGGEILAGQAHGNAFVNGQVLDFRQGGYVSFPHRSEFDLLQPLSVECWVWFEEQGHMPVLIGCGYWKHQNCLGVDLAKKGQPIIGRYKYPSQADIQCDTDHLPFSDETFDFAVSSHVLEHLQHPVNTIKEMARVTKQGGLILIVVPLGNHGDPYHRWVFNKQQTVQLAYSANVADIVQFD